MLLKEMTAGGGAPVRRPARALDSFFLGGFECSTHRRHDGRRLDVIAGTRHDELAARDYATVAEHGMRTVRDGMRWHLIESRPGAYDWSSLLPMLHAAKAQGTQVIWDLCHYGWPDDIDIWSSAFVDRFARYVGAATRVLLDEGVDQPLLSPINEISFWSWAGGEMGIFNPMGVKRGDELKRQLVRATIAGIDAIRTAAPSARIVQIDPVINVTAGIEQAEFRQRAVTFNQIQYGGWDMVAGLVEPELGGDLSYLDIIGVNYYPDNQWFLDGPMIPIGHPYYRPFREILADTFCRYGRPILIAETGAEGADQATWLRYVMGEVRAALLAGVPLQGVCLYPVMHYPGWQDDRRCATGLLHYADPDGIRPVDRAVADEWGRQRAITNSFRDALSGPSAG